MKINDHPLLEKNETGEEQTNGEVEQEQDDVNASRFSTFLPDYERIKYAIDGISKIYSSKILMKKQKKFLNFLVTGFWKCVQWQH